MIDERDEQAAVFSASSSFLQGLSLSQQKNVHMEEVHPDQCLFIDSDLISSCQISKNDLFSREETLSEAS